MYIKNSGYEMELQYNQDNNAYKGCVTNYEEMQPIEFYGDTINEVIELFNDWVEEEYKGVNYMFENAEKFHIKVKMVNDEENNDKKPILPTFGSAKAAGMDLYSAEDVVIKSNTPTLVKTGLKMQIPAGTELQIRPRSGLALSDGITVLNTPGTVDEDYRGEIGVILYWTGLDTTSNKLDVFTEATVIGYDKYISIPAGTRIAQAVLTPVFGADQVVLDEVDELDSTDRGEGGFGHTGIK